MRMASTLKLGDYCQGHLSTQNDRSVRRKLALCGDARFDSELARKVNAGITKMTAAHGPFLSAKDERAALDRVDEFMSQVIIPVAAETNAVILVSALSQTCILSRSLMQMVSLHRARWKGELPFSIISYCCALDDLYLNNDPEAEWRSVRKLSRSWQLQDKRCLELVHAQFAQRGKLPSMGYDLDPAAMCTIIVDSIDSDKNYIGNRAPGNHLRTELLRHLASTLPAISIKTGFSPKTTLQKQKRHQNGIRAALEAMMSGSPLVFIDMRQWEEEEAAVSDLTRTDVISRAKQQHLRLCDALKSAGVCDNLDTCFIAYFHDALNGDGSWHTTEADFDSQLRLTPLCEALVQSHVDQFDVSPSGLPKATSMQVLVTNTHLLPPPSVAHAPGSNRSLTLSLPTMTDVSLSVSGAGAVRVGG